MVTNIHNFLKFIKFAFSIYELVLPESSSYRLSQNYQCYRPRSALLCWLVRPRINNESTIDPFTLMKMIMMMIDDDVDDAGRIRDDVTVSGAHDPLTSLVGG